eukprot:scaffold54052_cov57-Phaeocystis_antarctica.AAC.1
MIDSYGDGWDGAEWAAPGFGQSFSLADGNQGTKSFVVQFQPPPSPLPPPSLAPPPSLPSPPPSPYPETLSIEGNPAYPSVTRGQYTRAAGLEYGGAPVYKRSYYSLYKRSNGKWYLDFNEVDESWSGTVNYALHASDTPFTATWNVDMVVVPN